MSKNLKVLTKQELEVIITIELRLENLLTSIKERYKKIGLTDEQIKELEHGLNRLGEDSLDWLRCAIMSLQELEEMHKWIEVE